MPLAAPDLDAARGLSSGDRRVGQIYLGTLLLPLEKRRAIWAIYVWCRRTDELMDSPEAQARSLDELSERLDHWGDRALFAGHVSDDLDWSGHP